MPTPRGTPAGNVPGDVTAPGSEPLRGGGPPPLPPPPGAPPVSNARLGILMFIGAETMLFAGLMGAYLLLRYGSAVWPPPGQPRLPLMVTAGNTAALTASAVTAWRAWRAIRAGDRARLRSGLTATALLGCLFLAVQGGEWLRLVRHGLSLSNTYGATFAALIGLHGAHVLGAVAWIVAVRLRAGGWRYSARRHQSVELASIYWIFVCGLWLVLFGLVYVG